MSQIVIKAQGLGKSYRIKHLASHNYQTMRDVVSSKIKSCAEILTGKNRLNQPEAEEFWALKDVSFEIKHGESVGVIGRNGAGKSTLLKILSRITEPTNGRISIRGRVASLLEVGTGFHPELSGRENIFLNGAILGMSRQEIRQQFDEIVAFAEVEKFLDTPVKHYSSGMYVRLAFAVAAHLDPEILIVDEVLSVGDSAFQKKCLGKMNDVAHKGKTVLFVSHNLGAIATFCKKCIYLAGGKLVKFDETSVAITDYAASTTLLSGECDLTAPTIKRRGSGKGQFTGARLVDEDGKFIANAVEGEPFKIELNFKVQEPIDISIISITLVDQANNDLYTTVHYDHMDITSLKQGLYRFAVTFKPNFLAPGSFIVRLASFGHNFYEHDHIHYAFSIMVAAQPHHKGVLSRRPGTVNFNLPWSMDQITHG